MNLCSTVLYMKLMLTFSRCSHPTSCASCAEILSVLFFNTMRYKVKAPRDANSDRFVMSKGHACPALYAAWAEAGLFPVSDLLNLRKIDNDLEGHPTPVSKPALPSTPPGPRPYSSPSQTSLTSGRSTTIWRDTPLP